MAEIRLTDKVKYGMGIIELCDILYQLVEKNEDGQLVSCDPDDMWIDQENTVRLTTNDRVNYAFCAPEIIMQLQKSGAIEHSKEAGEYAIGILAYYMRKGSDYFLDSNEHVIQIINNRGNRNSVIPAEMCGGDSYADAIEDLTAFNAREREAGVKALLKYIMKNSKAEAVVNFEANGTSIGTKTYVLTGNKDISSEQISNLGITYRCKDKTVLSYRPGKHHYTVQVSKKAANSADNSNQNRNAQNQYGNWELYVSKALFGQSPNELGRIMFLNDDAEKALRISTTFETVKIYVYDTSNQRKVLKNTFEVSKPQQYRGQYYYICLFYHKGSSFVEVQKRDVQGAVLEAPQRMLLNSN